jgi:hypothetical protein
MFAFRVCSSAVLCLPRTCSALECFERRLFSLHPSGGSCLMRMTATASPSDSAPVRAQGREPILSAASRR